MTRENIRSDRPVPSCGLYLLPADIRVGDEIEHDWEGPRIWAKVGRISRYGLRPRRYMFGFEPCVFTWQAGAPTASPRPITLRPNDRAWVWPAEVERPPPPPKSYESGSW
jgi:hypothetical protein